MNDGAEGNEYASIVSNDVKRLLVDAGFDFANSTANSEIQKSHFCSNNRKYFRWNRTDTSFSVNSLMKLENLQKMKKAI